MRGRSSLLVSAALAVAAMGGMALQVGANVVKAAVASPSVARNERKQLRSGIGGGSNFRKRGPGWTHAHVQRMAKKARNRRRNKAAHR